MEPITALWLINHGFTELWHMDRYQYELEIEQGAVIVCKYNAALKGFRPSIVTVQDDDSHVNSTDFFIENCETQDKLKSLVSILTGKELTPVTETEPTPLNTTER